MTVQDSFYNWQTNGAPADIAFSTSSKGGRHPSENLAQILAYLKRRWGGQNLGYIPNPRSIRDGASASTHTWGALDWRYSQLSVAGTEVSRETAVDEILPFLIDNSEELGIDVIHDYFGCRIWHAAGAGNGRPGEKAGWKNQPKNPNNGMGMAWATYFHIELVPSAFRDARTVEARVEPQDHPGPDPGDVPPTNDWAGLAAAKMAEQPPAMPEHSLKQGDVNDRVYHLQVVLRPFHMSDGARIPDCGGADGQFGPKTAATLAAVQAVYLATTADGQYGPVTHLKLQALSDSLNAAQVAPLESRQWAEYAQARLAEMPPGMATAPLTVGSKGQEVWLLQSALNAFDDIDVLVDGWYGPKTAEAVAYFQDHYLHIAADGEYGPVTQLHTQAFSNNLYAFTHPAG